MTLEILSNRLRYWEDQEDKNTRDSHIKDYENENISIRESFAAGQSKGSHSNYSPEEAAVESYPGPEEALPDEVTGVHSAKPESIPILNKHPNLRLTKYLLDNIHMYEDWKSLSPKKRKSRAKKLTARSLPVPDRWRNFDVGGLIG
ncbi:hypothetical protein N7488_012502 [Penicillium malachiteum]|nr:hypothetical protein N7488_012502 [Penicillium malachiteum]